MVLAFIQAFQRDPQKILMEWVQLAAVCGAVDVFHGMLMKDVIEKVVPAQLAPYIGQLQAAVGDGLKFEVVS